MMIDKQELLKILSDECAKAGTAKAWAEANGLSWSYVYDILRGKREPGPGTLDRLGYERVVMYRRREK